MCRIKYWKEKRKEIYGAFFMSNYPTLYVYVYGIRYTHTYVVRDNGPEGIVAPRIFHYHIV